jgi:cytidine deaminase
VRTPTDEELRLYEAARAAARNAYAPYSQFPVGAALQPAGGGAPVLGVNVENASFGLTCCAERTAIFTAVTGGLREFEAIAVHAEAGSAPPCGACRQVLAEFSPGMTVVFRHRGDVVASTAAELLPDRFEP